MTASLPLTSCQHFRFLIESATNIVCYQLDIPNVRDELLCNFKRSCRGAIRQPPNLIQWILGLTNLNKHGVHDTATTIAAWNAQCSKVDALVGGKYAACKLVMEKMPRAAFEMLASCVSRLGWNASPFSEDALNNRRIYPGHCFRYAKDGWKGKLCVTDTSMQAMMEHIIFEHENQHVSNRRKVPKRTLEECAFGNEHSLESLCSLPQTDPRSSERGARRVGLHGRKANRFAFSWRGAGQDQQKWHEKLVALALPATCERGMERHESDLPVAWPACTQHHVPSLAPSFPALAPCPSFHFPPGKQEARQRSVIATAAYMTLRELPPGYFLSKIHCTNSSWSLRPPRCGNGSPGRLLAAGDGGQHTSTKRRNPGALRGRVGEDARRLQCQRVASSPPCLPPCPSSPPGPLAHPPAPGPVYYPSP